MSMTDEQIVKALECCVRYENHLACRGCPFSGGICEEDGLALQKHSLALIKRQQADKERLEIELQTMRIAANSYKSRVQTLEMDNAQLHSDIVNANQNLDHINRLFEKAKQKLANTYKELQKAKAEIEELQEILGGTAKVQSQTCAVVRVKAVREFAERLKKKAYLNNYCVNVVTNDEIDNLVKEMTEVSENG